MGTHDNVHQIHNLLANYTMFYSNEPKSMHELPSKFQT